MFDRFSFAASVLLASLALPVSAQSLGKPVEFYFDADSNTQRNIVASRDSGEAAMAKLAKVVERNPRAIPEAAQLAHVAMEGGRTELGRQIYERTVRNLETSDALYRPVLWNYGWDLYRSGDAAAALAQWETLILSRRVNAGWIPTTLAMVLWKLDRKDEAVQWYAAAVRTEPGQWSGTARYAELLPAWRDTERATLAEVQAAWAENPPTWP
ncbi:tetratricopeptide repeat protein [Montanilutibacter psychrotolerans]|uniref:Tetratricopeptide repeat protein n=1 Tax=Montanilutibacter psychrotolerans TaxID=1327343 RepID=A0A3M8SQQ0_9GAMM|nr:tetratricopeptide repeat protein [Lysobacter psychrotolerans]RNF83658.1 tetratricopeptide repeat protein [Lysobacter psychrotolerans]